MRIGTAISARSLVGVWVFWKSETRSQKRRVDTSVRTTHSHAPYPAFSWTAPLRCSVPQFPLRLGVLEASDLEKTTELSPETSNRACSPLNPSWKAQLPTVGLRISEVEAKWISAGWTRNLDCVMQTVPGSLGPPPSLNELLQKNFVYI